MIDYEKPRILPKPETLKPCPFCGGSAELKDARKCLVVSRASYITPYSVSCGNRKCKVAPYTRYFDNEQEAITAWNRRAND